MLLNGNSWTKQLQPHLVPLIFPLQIGRAGAGLIISGRNAIGATLDPVNGKSLAQISRTVNQEISLLYNDLVFLLARACV